MSRRQSKDFGSRRESQDVARTNQEYVEQQNYYPDQFVDPNQTYGEQSYDVQEQYDPNQEYGGSYGYEGSGVGYGQYEGDQQQFGDDSQQFGEYRTQDVEGSQEIQDVVKEET